MITAEKNETATLSPPAREPQRSVAGRPAASLHGYTSSVAAAPAERHRPMARRGLGPVRRAQDFGWRSPEAAVLVVASFCVSLACFYVAAYARVTAEGFEAARLREQIRQTASQKEALEAEIARVTLPATVKARAVQLGMIPTTSQTVRVVTPPATESEKNK